MRGEEVKLIEQERASMERRVKHQIQVSLQASLRLQRLNDLHNLLVVSGFCYVVDFSVDAGNSDEEALVVRCKWSLQCTTDYEVSAAKVVTCTESLKL